MQATSSLGSTAMSAESLGDAKRRRRYLVDSTFQWKYTLVLATGVFLVATMMSMTMYGVLQQQARVRVLNADATGMVSSNATMILFALAFSIVVVVALACWGIVVTRRISGPVFLLQQCLRELRCGRFPKRRPLRKNDEFRELFEEFWKTVDYLQMQRRYHAAALLEMERSLESRHREDTAQGGALVELADQAKKIRNELAEVVTTKGGSDEDKADAARDGDHKP